MENLISNTTITLADTLKYTDDPIYYLDNLYDNKNNYRISVIDKSGTVIYDNYEDQLLLDNHSDRPEVQDAFNTGYGESLRFSNTLGEKTYYYATAINDNYVLRLSKTTNALFSIFKSSFPIIGICIFLSLLLSHYISLKLVKRVVEPINKIDLQNNNINAYDELSPLINTIKKQRIEINNQISILESRTSAIKTIVENMNEGIILIDNDEKILLKNSSISKMFNAKDSYIDKDLIELTRDLTLQNAVKLALTGNQTDLTIEIDNKVIQVLINPVLFNNEINGAVLLFIDISKKANNEKMRREFSANVSHELKTPLTTILGLSELIYNDMVDKDDYKKFGEKIKNESQRLLVLIENIIKVSQLDEKSFSNTFEHLNISFIINDVVKTLEPHIEEKNIKLNIATNGELIHGNKHLIHELIFNLIENAIKYNKVNGEIFVSTEYQDNHVKIIVKDTGVGIDEKYQDRVFERFYRVDKSRNKKTGGSGLGLSIVKHIVDNHDGNITLESKPEIGSTFTVII